MAYVELIAPYFPTHLVTHLTQWFTQRRTGRIMTERGASLVEYALLLALIVVVCIAAVSQMGTRVSSSFGSFSTRI